MTAIKTIFTFRTKYIKSSNILLSLKAEIREKLPTMMFIVGNYLNCYSSSKAPV